MTSLCRHALFVLDRPALSDRPAALEGREGARPPWEQENDHDQV